MFPGLNTTYYTDPAKHIITIDGIYMICRDLDRDLSDVCTIRIQCGVSVQQRQGFSFQGPPSVKRKKQLSYEKHLFVFFTAAMLFLVY